MNEIAGPLRAASLNILSSLVANYSAAQKYPEVADRKSRWNIIALVIATDAISAYFAKIRVSTGWVLPAVVLSLISISYLFTVAWPKRRIAAFFVTLSQYVTFANAAILLAYLAATPAFPLVDSSLARLDSALGFDWLAFFNWTKFECPVAGKILELAYASISIQLMVLIFVLSATREFARLRKLTWLIVLSLLIIIPLSVILPAEGAWGYYGVTHLTPNYYLPDFYAMRSGAVKVIDLSENMNGIVQFPSYHAALGLILIITTRGLYLFPLYLPLNILMIVSALTAGGHHLVDVIFGLLTVPTAMLFTPIISGTYREAFGTD